MTWVCTECTTAYAIGLVRCPRCHSTEFVPREVWDEMPKITAHGGPSNVNAEPGQPGYVEPLAPDEGSEDSSLGDSSLTSDESTETSSEPIASEGDKPARTTGSPTKRGRTGGSSARSTDTGQTGTSDSSEVS